MSEKPAIIGAEASAKAAERPRSQPFGLLFEESACDESPMLDGIYDEETDVSYPRSGSAMTTPLVECGLGGTSTRTDVRQEQTDTDPQDDRGSQWLGGTSTLTEAKGERTDTDPEDDSPRGLPVGEPEAETGFLTVDTPRSACPRALQGTRTLTRARGEATDSD